MYSRDSGINIYYCHSPPRFLYDLRNRFLLNAGRIRRLVVAIFEKYYRRVLENMDIIVVNSINVQNRLEHFLGKDSVILSILR